MRAKAAEANEVIHKALLHVGGGTAAARRGIEKLRRLGTHGEKADIPPPSVPKPTMPPPSGGRGQKRTAAEATSTGQHGGDGGDSDRGNAVRFTARRQKLGSHMYNSHIGVVAVKAFAAGQAEPPNFEFMGGARGGRTGILVVVEGLSVRPADEPIAAVPGGTSSEQCDAYEAAGPYVRGPSATAREHTYQQSNLTEEQASIVMEAFSFSTAPNPRVPVSDILGLLARRPAQNLSAAANLTEALSFSAIKSDPNRVVEARERLQRELGKRAPDLCLGEDGKEYCSVSGRGLWMVQCVMLLQLTSLYKRLPLLLPRDRWAKFAQRTSSTPGFLDAEEFFAATGCLLRMCVLLNQDPLAVQCDFGAWALMARMRSLHATGTKLYALARALFTLLSSVEQMALDQVGKTLQGTAISAISFHPEGFAADGSFEAIAMLHQGDFVSPEWLRGPEAPGGQAQSWPRAESAGLGATAQPQTPAAEWCKFGTIHEAKGRPNACTNRGCRKRHPRDAAQAKSIIDALVMLKPHLAAEGWAY